ncbi:MAG: ATP-binding protein, partial [Burkholderiales bacterium]
HDESSGWHVTVGQRLGERDELMLDASLTPLIPWLLALPLLLLANASVIRRALQPIRAITAEMVARRPDDLRPLGSDDLPAELMPMMSAGNALLQRIADLRQREKRFTDCAAHELRTPIATLRLQWDAVRAKPAVSSADVQSLGDSIARVARLTGQLLDLARAEDRVASAAPAVIDWQTSIALVVSDCLAYAEAAGVEIGCDWPEAGPGAAWPLHGDADQMQMLLRNLLDNAIRYSPEGAEIRIVVGTDGLAVVDHGMGVSEEAMARLGGRFYRVAGDHTGGTGLGLAIVTEIARVHGLAVTYAMTPGGGLTVSLRRQPQPGAAFT